MTAAKVLQDLFARGVRLGREGENVWLEPRSAIPDEVLEEARQHKAEILQILTGPGKVLPFRRKDPGDG